MKVERMGPTGLKRAYCEVCQATFTVAKGRCTGCIRREGNRKQGVVYVVCGLGLAAFGWSVAGPSVLGVAALLVTFAGVGITLRGVRAVLTGRNAEAP